jgi:hypothetical protein
VKRGTQRTTKGGACSSPHGASASAQEGEKRADERSRAPPCACCPRADVALQTSGYAVRVGPATDGDTAGGVADGHGRDKRAVLNRFARGRHEVRDTTGPPRLGGIRSSARRPSWQRKRWTRPASTGQLSAHAGCASRSPPGCAVGWRGAHGSRGDRDTSMRRPVKPAGRRAVQFVEESAGVFFLVPAGWKKVGQVPGDVHGLSPALCGSARCCAVSGGGIGHGPAP